MTGSPAEHATPRLVVRDAAQGRWLEFTCPQRIVTTNRIGEVLTLVRDLEEAVKEDGLYAAGFISYEAAPAFDPSLPAKADEEFPLLWFGLFDRAREIILEPGQDSMPTLDWQSSVSAEEYHDCLRAIRSYISDGDTYLTNFTYRLRTENEIDPWKLFVSVAGDGEAPYAAFVDTGEWAICSASPELFLALAGDLIESRPMKGTAARGLWSENDVVKRQVLVSSEKERAENLMITDMVRNDFGQVAECGSVDVSSFCTAEKYPTVWQMTSTIRARTEQPLDRILQATFPPASVTGAPRRRTMEIITELESSPRRVYTGTIGFLAPGCRAQFNVAIRTVLLHKDSGHAEYGVGGGIVWDSDPHAEYRECLTKMRVLSPGPRDFDLLETMLWSSDVGNPLLDYHLTRLALSADYFGFRADLHHIREELAKVVAGLCSGPYRIRLLVSRQGNVSTTATPSYRGSMGFGNITLAASPVDKGDVFLYHKTTHRFVYENALKMCPGSSDVLLFNEAGEVTESTIANVAVEIDGVIYTPPVRCGLLPGTHRAMLLDQGQLQERVVTVRELLQSPAVYLFNSVRGMQRVLITTSEAKRMATT